MKTPASSSMASLVSMTLFPMAPDEYAQLQPLAEQQGTSVAELVRKAVWDRYFIPTHREERKHALADPLSLQPIPVDDWSSMKK